MNDIEKNTIHPSHYNKEGRKECWEEMEEIFGIDSVIDFDILSAYKYLYRAGEKEGNPKEQDIAKIRNYVEHAEKKLNEWYLGYMHKSYEDKLIKLKEILRKEGIDIERTDNTND